MLKKIMFTVLILLSIYSIGVVSFHILQPKETIKQSYSTDLSYNSLHEYIYSSSSDVLFLFFYDKNDQNSIYVRETVLNTLKKETNLPLDDLIEYVDLSGADQDTLVTELATEWSIHSYPAFVAVRKTIDGIQVDNVLEWNTKSPMNTQTILNWLEQNQLYTSSN